MQLIGIIIIFITATLLHLGMLKIIEANKKIKPRKYTDKELQEIGDKASREALRKFLEEYLDDYF